LSRACLGKLIAFTFSFEQNAPKPAGGVSAGSVLMNSRNSCHRLPAPHTCCWGDGCYDKQGVPHCHGPKTCDHTHDNQHARCGGRNTPLMFGDIFYHEERTIMALPRQALVSHTKEFEAKKAFDSRRLLMWSHDGGETFTTPEWCSALPDPDCEGSMVADVDSGDLLFANNRCGTN
jgi:hypothetical protein